MPNTKGKYIRGINASKGHMMKIRKDMFFYIDKEHCIDAYDYPESLARYANDAEGYYRVKGIKNNSEYITKNGSVFIVATCDINSYSEIFTPYGEQYWEDFEPDDDMD